MLKRTTEDNMDKSLTYRGIRSLHIYSTRTSHLRRLGEMEEKAWQEFYDKYRSMIYAIGIKHQLSGPDLEDLTQSVIAVCCEKLRDFVYDPKRCRFRSFLYKIVENISRNIRRRNRRASRTASVVPAACEPDIDKQFMEKYREFLLQCAIEHLKRCVTSETFLIFEMLEIDGRPITEVAQLTNRSANALYGIRHRCLKKLRAIIDAMQAELEAPSESATGPARRKVPRS